MKNKLVRHFLLTKVTMILKQQLYFHAVPLTQHSRDQHNERLYLAGKFAGHLDVLQEVDDAHDPMSTHQQRDKDPWHQRLLHKVIGGIKDAAAGVTGGVSLVMVGQPFDTVKVRMQTNSECYRGPWHCFTSTLKNEGIRGLYSGTVPALLSNVCSLSCYRVMCACQ